MRYPLGKVVGALIILCVCLSYLLMRVFVTEPWHSDMTLLLLTMGCMAACALSGYLFGCFRDDPYYPVDRH